MAIRYDFYTIYHDEEYRVWNNDGMANLVSNDIGDLDNGFTEYDPDGNNNPRIFIKLVPPSEIGDVYKITTFALYKGYEFPIINESSKGEYVLFASTITPYKLLEQLGFKQGDQGSFYRKIKKEEADLVYEKKRLITDFFE